MITVKVLKISYHPSTRSYFILLKDVDGEDCISLSVGSFEAQSIALALESIEEKRPTTHDLICHLLSEIGFSLKRVRITDLKDGIFYSVIDLESKKYGSYNIDAKPSDAIAISLRENAPILISDNLIKNPSFQRDPFSKLKNNTNNKNLLSKLKIRLMNAVKNENYEVAAEIRDKIKKIKS
ncbi:MAG: bifunctional nuclease domain-containing protein [Candidatus Neomarinimicrobiota bacterium]